jgi:hypothetical protein
MGIDILVPTRGSGFLPVSVCKVSIRKLHTYIRADFLSIEDGHAQACLNKCSTRAHDGRWFFFLSIPSFFPHLSGFRRFEKILKFKKIQKKIRLKSVVLKIFKLEKCSNSKNVHT